MNATSLAWQATAGVFITGSGTDVGKTYLTTQLLMHDQNQNCNRLQASKPVISGWPENQNEWSTTDTGLILSAQNQSLTLENIEHCSPWRLIPPVTPWMALEQENQTLSLKQIVEHCQGKILQAKNKNHCHLFEGAAGVMAPLTEQYTMLDWIKALNLPCIIVAGSYLGTLSHTLSTVSVIQNQNIKILAVIINETKNSTVGLNETVACLRVFLPQLNILKLPYGFTYSHEAIAQLYEVILKERQTCAF